MVAAEFALILSVGSLPGLEKVVAQVRDGPLHIVNVVSKPCSSDQCGAGISVNQFAPAMRQRHAHLPLVRRIALAQYMSHNGEYFLRARLNVSVAEVERDVAQELIEIAHEICPYSKATRGNIDVSITLV